jgi:hypothetical protein
MPLLGLPEGLLESSLMAPGAYRDPLNMGLEHLTQLECLDACACRGKQVARGLDAARSRRAARAADGRRS